MKYLARFLVLFFLSTFVTQAASWDKELKWSKEVGARSFPNGKKEYSILNYGAINSQTVLNTVAIQKAIDDCHQRGGGKVIIPAGNYLTGSLYLKEGVHLVIEKGATLWGSTNIQDYPEIDTRVAGIEMRWPSALINILDTKNVMISGKGKIHAQGKVFWDYYWNLRKEYETKGLRWIVDYDAKRPRTLLVSNSSDITLKEVTLQQAGFWTVQILYSEYCTVDGLVIQNNIDGHGPSTDGIDIDSSTRILLENCEIDCNDDNFCLKAGRDADGLRVNRPTEYIVIRNCLSRAGGGLLTCGSETSGSIRYVLAYNLKAEGTMSGIRLKSAMNRGGVVSHIYVRDIEMDEVGVAFDATNNWNPSYSYSELPKEYEGKELPSHWVKMLEKVNPEKGTPKFNHIYLSDFHIKKAKKAMVVTGSKNAYMEDFFFDNMYIHAEKGGTIAYARNWKMTNMKIQTNDNLPISVSKSENIIFPEESSKEVNLANWPLITKEAKPWTRWWWLGSAVDKAGITYNLEEMAKAGIGGVEITPIYGVQGNEQKNLNYLSSQWMDMYAYTLEEAKRLEMEVDMNTGTGWPFGGKEIQPKDAASKVLFQFYTINKGEKLQKKVVVEDKRQRDVAHLQRLMAYPSKGEILDLTSKVQEDGTLDWIPIDDDYKLIALFCGKTLQQVKRAAPGGEGLVMDHLNSSSVKTYLTKFDRAFDGWSSLFPHNWFNDSYEVGGADWTENFLQEFESRRGYKLENYLPALLNRGRTDESIRVISDYRETISDLLKECFTEQWTQWAHSQGVQTRNQAHGSPANLVDLYATVDVPECETFGISDFDIPGLRKDSIKKINDGDPTILKYASSAAHITGKKVTSSEIFTWLTDHFRTSLSQCKPEIDQVFTSGVNHIYFHGSAYSPKEATWPGWRFYASVDMTPNNSIWRDAPAFFKYVARVQSFLQEGLPDNDFLIYYPVYDLWAESHEDYYLPFTIHDMKVNRPSFHKTVEEIRTLGYDVDYISDQYIQSLTVQDKQIKVIGGNTYKALILPSVERMQPQTLNKIKELVQQGATVLIQNGYPSKVPGFYFYAQREEELNKVVQDFPSVSSLEKVQKQTLGKGTIFVGADFQKLLKQSGFVPELFVTKWGGQMIRRKQENGLIYFLTMLQNNPINDWVPLSSKVKSALLYNPMNGESGKAIIRINNGVTEVFLQLQPGESLLLKTFNKDIQAEKWNYYTNQKEIVELKEWSLAFSQSEPAIRDTFKIDHLDSWTNLQNEDLKRNMGTGVYSTIFKLDDLSFDEYELQLGDVRESAQIRINNQEVTTLYAVPYRTYIKKFLKKGINTLEIAVTNLPANRIADYDRRGVEWRIFEEINVVNVFYQKEKYDHWNVVPSGLLGPVKIMACQTTTTK